MSLRIVNILIISLLTIPLTACNSVFLKHTSLTNSAQIANSEESIFNRISESLHPKNILEQQSIFFDFGDSSIPTQYYDLLEIHAHYLINNRDQCVRIEGNTDQKGSTEYNLILGQRRADSIRHVLTTLGVNDSQIEVVIFGKSRIQSDDLTEVSFSDNRRVDIIYQ